MINSVNLEACAECDLLVKSTPISTGEVSCCPRCGYRMQQPRQASIERCFAYSVAGLALIVPANVLPILGIQVMGNSRDGNLWSGVMALFNEGMWGIAVLVCLASIVFPALKVVLTLLVSASVYFNRPGRYLATWMRYLHHLEEWAMLEVYTLGIIVACVKLAGVAELKFGYGLYAFIALLIINNLLTVNLDKQLFWQRIRQLRKEYRDVDQ